MRLTARERYVVSLWAKGDPSADMKLRDTVYGHRWQTTEGAPTFDQVKRYVYLHQLGDRLIALRQVKQQRMARSLALRPEYV